MREKLKTVKNAVVHVLILLLVFIGAVVLFEKLINQSTPNSAQDMENSTFPLVYMQNKGVSYNCLHGYAYEMDVANIRDTVTVLGDSHELDIQIQPFSSNVESVSYEVLSLDGTEFSQSPDVGQSESADLLQADAKPCGYQWDDRILRAGLPDLRDQFRRNDGALQCKGILSSALYGYPCVPA